MARIYTRGGDRGQTSLGDGSRTAKSGPRVDLYGEVDELISWIGHAGALLAEGTDGDPVCSAIGRDLVSIQNRLFCLASVLANPALSAQDTPAGAAHPAFDPAHLEQRIDEMDGRLPALTRFILPGGPPCVTVLQLARTVCRRVERKAVALGEAETAAEAVPERGIIYLNRLSDYLFVAARAVGHALGAPERAWDQTEGADD